MDNNYIKELNIYIIQNKYKLLTYYLLNLQKHINSLYEYNFISLYDRNIYIGKIYENTKLLNSEYNEYIINDFNKENEDKIIEYLNEFDSRLSFNNIYLYLLNINILSNDIILNSFLNPLNEIKKKIINISFPYGNKNIYLILSIILGLEFNLFYNEKTKQILKFLNNSIIPLKYTIINKEFVSNITKYKEFNNEINDYFNDISITLKKSNNDDLLNRVVILKIRNIFTNNIIQIEGLFIVDSINLSIKTCQICNKYLYYKKRILEKKLVDTKATKKI